MVEFFAVYPGRPMAAMTARAHDKLHQTRRDSRTAVHTTERRSVVEIFEPARGGVPTHVALLAGGLIARGWHVTVVGPEESSAMDQLVEAGAHLVPLKIAHPPHPRDILSIRALLKACGKGSSLIHAHSTKAGMLAAWTSRLSGVPSVYTPHSWSFDRALPASLRAGYVIYERRTARAHRLVIAVSESERHLALQHRIKEQSAIRVVYNGLPSTLVELDRASARPV